MSIRIGSLLQEGTGIEVTSGEISRKKIQSQSLEIDLAAVQTQVDSPSG